jgi:hypothetical protein
MAAMNSAAAEPAAAEPAGAEAEAFGSNVAAGTGHAPRNALASATMSVHRRMLGAVVRGTLGLLRTDLRELHLLATAHARPVAAQTVAVGGVDLVPPGSTSGVRGLTASRSGTPVSTQEVLDPILAVGRYIAEGRARGRVAGFVLLHECLSI